METLQQKGRPSFIDRRDFRRWMTIHSMSKILGVGGITSSGYIHRCDREGRPIKRFGNKLRPLDVVARARASGLEIHPPRARKVEIDVAVLEAEVKRLSRRRDELKHSMAQAELSMTLTGKALLREPEIVAASQPMPELSGIYFLISEGRVMYVGQSTNVINRVSTHAKSRAFESFAFCPCSPEELDVFESLYIHLLQPPENGRLTGRSAGSPYAPLSLDTIRKMAATSARHAGD